MKVTKNNKPKRVRNHVNPLADQTIVECDQFNHVRPLIVDVGAYQGEFSQALLDTHGDAYNYIVTEIRTPYVTYLKSLFTEYPHVRVFGGDTTRNITGLLHKPIEQGCTLDYVFINFPDPWFKKKHKKRRVLNELFLRDIHQYMDTNSKIIFQTDQKQLFEETQELIDSDYRFVYQEFSEPLWNIQSHWEQQKQKEGALVYRMKIQLSLKSI